MSKYVVRSVFAGMVAHHDNGKLLVWETREGAQKFVDMNGGLVTPVAVLSDGTVRILPIESLTEPEHEHGQLQFSF